MKCTDEEGAKISHPGFLKLAIETVQWRYGRERVMS